MKKWIAGLALLVAEDTVWGQGAIRLKSGRVIRPGETSRRVGILPGGTHYVLQFGSYPGSAVRLELERRHIRVLGYLPDSALTVVAGGTVDLEGLGVIWAGPLDGTDKISPLLSSGSAPGFLVVFHPDIGADAGRFLIEKSGFQVIPNRHLLGGHLLAAGAFSGVAGLAASDEVAYILPASSDLMAGNPVMSCAGALTEVGPVAQYVEVGSGWPRDTAGRVDLQYFFQTLTTRLEESVVRGEVERAFREWQKYANLTLTAGGQADSARTIAIQFARSVHGDAYPFDGPGGVLAHTFYPAPPNSEPVAGDMHLDADEDWHAGNDTDLFSVVLHEAGHALGLGHSDRPGAVMYPYYRFASGLTDDDIAGIQNLYGPAGSQPAVLRHRRLLLPLDVDAAHVAEQHHAAACACRPTRRRRSTPA